MALNNISTETSTTPVLTKILRRTDKLALALTKRQLVATNGYRTLNVMSGTHTSYVSTSTSIISGTASPTVGHPWAAGI